VQSFTASLAKLSESSALQFLAPPELERVTYTRIGISLC